MKHLFNYIILFIFSIIFISCDESTGAAYDPNAVSGDEPTISVENLQNLTFAIELVNITNISYLHFTLKYDDSKIQYKSMTYAQMGEPLVTMIEDVPAVEPGGVTFAFANTPMTADGRVVTIEFTGNVTSYTGLYLSDVHALDNSYTEVILDKRRVCYADGFSSIGRDGEEWTEYGEFIWTNRACLSSYMP